MQTGPLPQPLAPGECRTSPQVLGIWTSSGQSQLGPAHSRYTFDCDCVVEVRSSLLWARMKGAFRYSVAGDAIVLEQKRPRTLRFTRDGDTLEIVWPGGDRESLKLDQAIDCANVSK